MAGGRFGGEAGCLVTIYDDVRARDGGCLRCGTDYEWRGLQIHHRQGRRGPHAETMSNLVVLCGACHQWVTEHAAAAYDTGWQVRRLGGANPALIPVLDLMGHWWLVGDTLTPSEGLTA